MRRLARIAVMSGAVALGCPGVAGARQSPRLPAARAAKKLASVIRFEARHAPGTVTTGTTHHGTKTLRVRIEAITDSPAESVEYVLSLSTRHGRVRWLSLTASGHYESDDPVDGHSVGRWTGGFRLTRSAGRRWTMSASHTDFSQVEPSYPGGPQSGMAGANECVSPPKRYLARSRYIEGLRLIDRAGRRLLVDPSVVGCFGERT